MWINKFAYDRIKEEIDNLKEERDNAQAQCKALQRFIAEKEQGNVPIILGKYFIAEYNNDYGKWLWRIYRNDYTIKPEKKFISIFGCFTKENAETLVKYYDEVMDTLLERKSTLLTWLMNAHKMAKRVYIEVADKTAKGIDAEFVSYEQLKDGAVPMWWINQEIDRILKMKGKNE